MPDPELRFEQNQETGLLQGPLADLSGFQGDYGYITDISVLDRYLDKLHHDGKPVCFDIETGYRGMDAEKRSLDIYNLDQFVVGISLTNNTSMARYVPLKHDLSERNLDPNQVWPRFKQLFESGDVDLVAHQCKFEQMNLSVLDLKGDGPNIHLPPDRVHDPMLQSYVIGQVGRTGSREHGLKFLSKHWFNYEQRELSDLVSSYAPVDKNGKPKFTAKQKAALRFNPLPLDHAVQQYVCDDVTWCLRLDQWQRPSLDVFGSGLSRVYETERQISNLLVEMAGFGISVDWDGLRSGLDTYHVVVSAMEKEGRRLLAELVDDEFAASFNFGSPQQVSKLLFDRMGLTPVAYTEREAPSTSETSLEALRREHPIIDAILKLRQARKMGQWFEKWVGFRTAYDDKVHPSLNQIQVQSGRFASDNPNVQNITKKWWYTAVQRDWDRHPLTDAGQAEFESEVVANYQPDLDYWTGNARSFLTASPGYKILSFDYQAQELRVLAGLSQEPYLIESFQQGIDIHRATASKMLDVPIHNVSPEQRQQGKTLNFALLYGEGPKAMGDSLGISLVEAKDLYAKYFSAFTSVRDWIDEAQREGKKHGFVTSFYGRRSTVWELLSDSPKVQSKADRMCVNVRVQGGGADITKAAMLRSRKALADRGLWGDGVRMLMNQHDSLVFEIRDDLDPLEIKDILEPEVMLTGDPLLEKFPPMEVDWEIGDTWGGVTELVDDRTTQDRPRSALHVVPDSEIESLPSLYVVRDTTRSPGGTMKVQFTHTHDDESFSVELTDADGEKQFGEEQWEDWSVLSRFKKLSALTEVIGVNYLHSHGQLPTEPYQLKVKQLMEDLKA